jgi:hypothetical protein
MRQNPGIIRPSRECDRDARNAIVISGGGRQHENMQLRLLLGALAIAAGVTAALLSHAAAQLNQRHFSGSIDDPAIAYSEQPTTEAVSKLASQLAAGTAKPAFEPFLGSGYLPYVLDALDVPIESQILVFTKTGVQGQFTGPANPRALYFNDSVVVGYIRGAPFLELAGQDARQGVIFYTLPQTPTAPASLTRRNQCLSCHQSFASLDVPGMLVRSHFTSPKGVALRQLGSFTVDHRTPFADRWGGWYVTGTHGEMRHLGNAVVTDVDKPETAVTAATLNVKSLEGRFDRTGYLSSDSDIVALMVFEHQMHAINLITRVGWETRVARAANRLDLATGPLADAVNELADYLLFVDEARLTWPVQGTTGFAATFGAKGPRDRKDRSLRQFDLRTRLFRYPCSYMIYTDAFDALPPEARSAIYQRMWRILSGDGGVTYRVSATDRRAIIEILRETKRGLPDYFR